MKLQQQRKILSRSILRNGMDRFRDSESRV